MASLIKLHNVNSTKTSPIRFFVKYSSSNLIQQAKESFLVQFPKPVSNDRWSKFSTEVDNEKESFTVEYQKLIGFDEANEEEILEWQTVNYTFKGELEKYLREKFDESISLLKENLATQIPSYKNELLHDILIKLLDGLTAMEENEFFHPYIVESKKPYNALIRHLYLQYIDFMPSQNVDSRIGKALLDSEKTKELYTLYNLSVDVFKKIIDIKDYNEKKIFLFTDPQAELKKFEFFYKGDFNKITTPIHFIKNLGAANYLISRLAFYLGYSYKEIRDGKIFKLGTSGFTENACRVESARIAKRQNNIKFLIDRMIESSIS